MFKEQLLKQESILLVLCINNIVKNIDSFSYVDNVMTNLLNTT